MLAAYLSPDSLASSLASQVSLRLAYPRLSRGCPSATTLPPFDLSQALPGTYRLKYTGVQKAFWAKLTPPQCVWALQRPVEHRHSKGLRTAGWVLENLQPQLCFHDSVDPTRQKGVHRSALAQRGTERALGKDHTVSNEFPSLGHCHWEGTICASCTCLSQPAS